MIYQYVCDNAECGNKGNTVEVSKLVSELDREESCETCSQVMRRVFALSTNINLGKIGGGYNFHERDMGFGKKEKYTEVKGEQTVAYAYQCQNAKCGSFNEPVTVYKKMTECDRVEKCQVCNKKMGRIFNCSYRWGKGSRPDSDKRKEQMCDALQKDDFTRIAELQNNYDSTGRSYFTDDKKREETKHKVVGSDFEREYEYTCDNKECADFEKAVYVKKPLSQSGRDEQCEKCNEMLRRIYGMGGFTFKEEKVYE